MSAIINARDVLLQAAGTRSYASQADVALAAADAAALAAADAQADADAANTALAIIASDSWLSKGEKPAVVKEWLAITAEYVPIKNQAISLAVSYGAYETAIDALSNYLVSLNDWSNPAIDTAIVSADFKAAFNDYYAAKVAILNSISLKVKTDAAADATAKDAAIVVGGRNLHTDSSFQRGTRTFSEKSGTVTAAIASSVVGSVVGNLALFIESGAPTSGKDSYVYLGGTKTPVVAGRQYMLSYYYATASNGAITGASSYIRYSNGSHAGLPMPTLNTGGAFIRASLAWTCPSGVTDIEFRFGIGCDNYSWIAADCIQVEEGNKATQWSPAPEDAAADTALAQSAANNAATQAALANTEIANIAGDNVLSRAEKSNVTLKEAEINGEFNDIIAKADAVGVSRVAYYNSRVAMNAYLAGLSPSWSDLTTNTVIVGTTFRAIYSDYYTARQLLLNAIAAKAATMATAEGLQVGIGGRNVLANSLPTSLAGYTHGFSPGITLATGSIQHSTLGGGVDIYSRTRMGSVWWNASGTPTAGGNVDLYSNAGAARMLVVPGQRYEFGVDLSVHRCNANLVVAWYNSAGTYLGENPGNTINLGATYASIPFPRSVLFFTAPAGAASCMVFVRGWMTGESEPYVFASEWYAGTALAAQTVASAWTEAPAVTSYNVVVAAADATAKAAAAQANAIATAAIAAQTKADLAEVTAKAYADGIVTVEEARAIADATAKANAAQAAATSAAAADATAKANVAATTANQDSVITTPGGGFRLSQTSSEAGAIKIALPVSWTDTMMRFTVDIFEYAVGLSCTIEIAGYNHSSGWINVTARVVGGSNVEYPVRFGHDGAKCCVWIGNPATETWSYPQIRVRDVFLGFSNFAKATWENGWVISISAAALTNVTGEVLDTYPAADWTKVVGTGRPANNATVGAPAGTNVGNTPAATVEAGAANGTSALNALGTALSVTALSTLSSTGANGLRTYGTRTASASGGTPSYTYLWSVTYVDTNDTGGYITLQDADTATVTVKGSGTNTQLAGRLTCIITDSGARVKTISCSVLPTHGTPP